MKRNSDRSVTVKMKSPKRKGLKPSDPDFIAPDGGWGWFIAFACGVGNLSIIAMFEQYGLTFIDEFERLKINHSQTTTIFNINASLTALIGLLNGPIYRKYSYRQIAVFGSTFVTISLFTLMWCKSFWSYCLVYGILYGSAIGLTQTAYTVALNTYFKRNRSTATGISMGITGIASGGCPHVINIFLTYYGIHGALLLFTGISCHSIMCSLLLQPVHWHTKHKEDETDVSLMPIERSRSNSLPACQNVLRKFITDNHPLEDIDSSNKSMNVTTESNRISENIKYWINAYQDPAHNFKQKINFTSEPLLENTPSFNNRIEITPNRKVGFFSNISQKCVSVFDFDLLKDLVYLNIIVGKTIICFVEFNFALLTPIILWEFNFERHEIAIYLSFLGGSDTIVRFLAPFITNKIKWNCRVYFLIGSLITTVGRIFLIHTRTFKTSLIAAVIIGFGKGLRIIYMALVIPDYVPLEKLPAALGIYLAMFGTCLMVLAPVVGIIRDITESYVITMHILNVLIYITTISWIVEYLYRKRRSRSVKAKTNVNNLNL